MIPRSIGTVKLHVRWSIRMVSDILSSMEYESKKYGSIMTQNKIEGLGVCANTIEISKELKHYSPCTGSRYQHGKEPPGAQLPRKERQSDTMTYLLVCLEMWFECEGQRIDKIDIIKN